MTRYNVWVKIKRPGNGPENKIEEVHADSESEAQRNAKEQVQAKYPEATILGTGPVRKLS